MIYRGDPTTQLRKLPEFSKPPPPVPPDVSGMSSLGDGNAGAGFDDDLGPGPPTPDGQNLPSADHSPEDCAGNQDWVGPLHGSFRNEDDEEYSPASPMQFSPVGGDVSSPKAMHVSEPADAASLDDPFETPAVVLERLPSPKSSGENVEDRSIHAGGGDEAAGNVGPAPAPMEVQMEAEARPLDPPEISDADRKAFDDCFEIGSKTPSRGYASRSPFESELGGYLVSFF